MRRIHCLQISVIVAAALAGGLVNQASLYGTTIGLFTGGDPGEGLDFSGNFVYAVDVAGASTATIGSATFTPEASTVGFTSTANNSFAAPAPVYGASTNDDNLELIMSTLDYDTTTPTPSINLTFANLVSGGSYAFQVLFYDDGPAPANQRIWNLFEEGVNVASNFQLINVGGPSGTKGVVWSGTFIASAGNTALDLSIVSAIQNPSYTTIVNAATLELLPPVPEPSTLALLGLGVVGMAVKARRRRAGA